VVNVPRFAHARYLQRLVNGGVSTTEAEQRLGGWYAEVCDAWRGRVIGDREGDFWDKRFAEWQGTTAAPVASRRPAWAV
jgi:hypothetical protein